MTTPHTQHNRPPTGIHPEVAGAQRNSVKLEENQFIIDFVLQATGAIATHQTDELWSTFIRKISPAACGLYYFRNLGGHAHRLHHQGDESGREYFPISIPRTSAQLQAMIDGVTDDFQLLDAGEHLPFPIVYLPILNGQQKIGFFLVRGQSTDMLSKGKNIAQQCSYHLIQAALRFIHKSHIDDQNRVLGQLLEKSDESFASWDKDRGWIFHNTSLLQRIMAIPEGVKLTNIFGHPDYMESSEWQEAMDVLTNCIKKGEEVTYKYSIRASNGEEHTFQTNLKVKSRNADNSAASLTAVSVDISENHRFIQTITENAGLDAWLLEINSRLFNECNTETMRQTLQAVAEKFNFDRAYIRLYDENKSEAPVFIEWQKPSVAPISVVNPVLRIDRKLAQGNYVIEDTYAPTDNQYLIKIRSKLKGRSHISRPVYFNNTLAGLVIFQNIHPAKFGRLEKRATKVITDALSMVIARENLLTRLGSSRERFQMAMDAASYGLWELNLLNQTIYLSPNYYEILGYNPQKLDGFRPLIVDNIHFDDKQTVIDYTQKLASGEMEEFSLEARHLTVKGDLLWILMRGKIIKRDDTGRPIRAMGTMTDITQLKKTQTDLQLAHQEALSAHQAKSEFLARMSHEIRTPMNAIIGMTYLALQARLTTEQSEYLNDIDQAAKSLLHIIDDILDFSKIEAGKLTIENHEFIFLALVENIAARFNNVAKSRDLQFSYHVDKSLPKTIIADSTRIGQVLDYLLNNAFKFTNVGGVSLTIEKLSETNKDIAIQFIVKDTGIGLTNEQLLQLFTAFSQADGSSSRQYGGTGLGLAISKHLVEMMGGEIAVTSEPNRGSEFRFTLTCSTCIEHRTTLIDTTGEDPDFQILSAKKVLLVEDNKVNQKVAAGILRKRQMNVTIANNGAEAVYIMKASETNAFDVILMDLEMPYMNGIEATEAILSIPRHSATPIIGMTAHHVGEEKTAYLSTGMVDCVSKPIAPTTLYTLLMQYTIRHST